MVHTHNIYLIGNKSKGLYKIGCCRIKKSPQTRLKELQTGCPFPLKVFEVFQTKFGLKLERALHRRFMAQRTDQDGEEKLVGEWFCLSIIDAGQFLETCKKTENNIEIILTDSTIKNIEKRL